MKDYKPSFTAIVDSREQNPLDLFYAKDKKLSSITSNLYTGDYSIQGLEKYCVVERKSLPDLIMCIGRERQRFEKELDRLRGIEVKALVVESTWADIEQGNYRSKLTPQSAIGSLLGWISAGLPIIMAGNRTRAGWYTAKILVHAARRRQAQLKSLEL